jgi:hypothetical protein
MQSLVVGVVADNAGTTAACGTMKIQTPAISELPPILKRLKI